MCVIGPQTANLDIDRRCDRTHPHETPKGNWNKI